MEDYVNFYSDSYPGFIFSVHSKSFSEEPSAMPLVFTDQAADSTGIVDDQGASGNIDTITAFAENFLGRTNADIPPGEYMFIEMLPVVINKNHCCTFERDGRAFVCNPKNRRGDIFSQWLKSL